MEQGRHNTSNTKQNLPADAAVVKGPHKLLEQWGGTTSATMWCQITREHAAICKKARGWGKTINR